MKKANEIINHPIKAILFGKFYERIILRWLKERRGFVVFDGKPRIYWKDVEYAKGNSELVNKLNKRLKGYKNKKFCTPDGFMEKKVNIMFWRQKTGHFGRKAKNHSLN